LQRCPTKTVNPIAGNAMSKLEALNDIARADVNHYQLFSVSAGLTHARISVNRNISQLSIKRSGYLVTSHVSLGDHCDLSA